MAVDRQSKTCLKSQCDETGGDSSLWQGQERGRSRVFPLAPNPPIIPVSRVITLPLLIGASARQQVDHPEDAKAKTMRGEKGDGQMEGGCNRQTPPRFVEPFNSPFLLACRVTMRRLAPRSLPNKPGLEIQTSLSLVGSSF